MNGKKQSYQALIGAELPMDEEYWSVEEIADNQVTLKARGKTKQMDLSSFMNLAHLNMDDFDPSTMHKNKNETHERTVNQLEGVRCWPIQKNHSEYERRSSLTFPTYPRIAIDHTFDTSKIRSFVAFDTEATGLAPDDDRIVQLSAVRFVDGKPSEYFDTYVNPDKKMNFGAYQVTGINDDMLKDAPHFNEIADSFKDFVKQDPLVGYYIRFDLRMLWCAGLDLVTTHTIYDAQWYTFDLLPKGYLPDRKLSTVAKALNIDFPAHNSLGDSYATGMLFMRCVKDKMQLF